MRAPSCIGGGDVYGTTAVLWERLSRAELAFAARRRQLAEVERRHEAMAQQQSGIEPRTVVAPAAPSDAERARHATTHSPPAPWCEACVLGQDRERSHQRVNHDGERSSGVPHIVCDL